ncbi:wd repeat and fyve domain-containing protein 3 [Nannochloropsis oceanica]
MHAWLSRVASSATGAGKRRGGEGNNTSSDGDPSSPGGSRVGGFGSVANYRGGGTPLSAEDMARGHQITDVCENLVREIQRILRSAKEAQHHHQQQQQNESSRWAGTDDLLALLAGAADTSPSPPWAQTGTEEEVVEKAGPIISLGSLEPLLDHPQFVSRCLEAALPPNLGHCLRLMRVIELENASPSSTTATAAAPLTVDATARIARLLVRLCQEGAVVEQLRQHLEGLFKLTTAPYPPTGGHVQAAAFQVAEAISSKALSSSLIWFIHDRQIVMKMVEDMFDLCLIGSSREEEAEDEIDDEDGKEKNDVLADYLLLGPAAEKAGMWLVAAKAIVSLICNSCRHSAVLVADLHEARGYDVFRFMIRQSSSDRRPELLAGLTLLIGTGVENEMERMAVVNDGEGMAALGNPARNIAAFEVLRDVLVDATPVLRAMAVPAEERGWSTKKAGKSAGTAAAWKKSPPSLGPQAPSMDLTAVTRQSIEYLRQSSKVEQEYPGVVEEREELQLQLLSTLLQIYSNHPRNYALLEPRFQALSLFLACLSSFRSPDLKLMVIKTLEYVCSGVANCAPTDALHAAAYTFMSCCEAFLGAIHGEQQQQQQQQEKAAIVAVNKALHENVEMVCETLEKLMQFDHQFVEVLGTTGVLGEVFYPLLARAVEEANKTAAATAAAAAAAAIAIEEEHQAAKGNVSSSMIATPAGVDEVVCLVCRVLVIMLQETPGAASRFFRGVRLQQVLYDIIGELGLRSTLAALKVLQLAALADHAGLRDDLTCLVELLQSSRHERWRQLVVLKAMKDILTSNSVANELWRSFCGFEATVAALSSLDGAFMVEEGKEGSGMDVVVDTSKGSLVSEEEEDHGSLGGGSFDGGFCSSSASSSSAVTVVPHTISKDMLPLPLPVKVVDETEHLHNVLEAGHEQEICLELIKQIIRIITLAISGKVLGNLRARVENRQYLKNEIGYDTLKCCLLNSKVLTRERFSREIVECIFMMVTEETSFIGTCGGKGYLQATVKNADAALLLFSLLTELPRSVATYILQKLLQLIANSTYVAAEQLCLAGALRQVLDQFYGILNDPEDPLYSHLLRLLYLSGRHRVTVPDTISMLRCLGRPLFLNKDGAIVLCPSFRRQVALHPDLAKRRRTALEKQWRSLLILAELAETSDSVPFLRLGGGRRDLLALARKWACEEPKEIGIMDFDSVYAATAYSEGMRFVMVPTVGGTQPITSSSGFTYSCWFRFGVEATDFAVSKLDEERGEEEVWGDGAPATDEEGGITQQILWLFTVSSISAKSSLQVYLDLTHHQLCVESYVGKGLDTELIPIDLEPGQWHHFMLVHRRARNLLSNTKNTLAVYLNGIEVAEAFKTDHVSFLESPTSRCFIGVPLPDTLKVNESVLRGAVAPIWHLGPVILTLEALPVPQAAVAIYATGPSYVGSFQGERPVHSNIQAIVTALLARLHRGGAAPTAAAAASTGGGETTSALLARGLQDVLRMDHRRTREEGLAALLSLRIPLEQVVFSFHAGHASPCEITPRNLSGTSHQNLDIYHEPCYRLVNTIGHLCEDGRAQWGVVFGDGALMNPLSISDSVFGIAGPQILFPLLEVADSPTALCVVLELVKVFCRGHTANLECMQGSGYRVMVFLLARKKHLFSPDVLRACVALAVDTKTKAKHDSRSRGASTQEQAATSAVFPPSPSPGHGHIMDESAASFSFTTASSAPSSFFSSSKVLVDAAALKYLVLNWELWGGSNDRAIVIALLKELNGLVAPQNPNAVFNAYRLHSLGLVRWTLSVMMQAAKLSSAGQAGGWVLPRISLEDAHWARTSAALPDKLLTRCGELLQRLLLTRVAENDVNDMASVLLSTVAQRPSSEKFTSTTTDGVSINSIATTTLKSSLHPIVEVVKVSALNGAKGVLSAQSIVRIYLLEILIKVLTRQHDRIRQSSGGGAQGVVKKVMGFFSLETERLVGKPVGGSGGSSGSLAGAGRAGSGSGSSRSKSQCSEGAGAAAAAAARVVFPEDRQEILKAFSRCLSPDWFHSMLDSCRDALSISLTLRALFILFQEREDFVADFAEYDTGFGTLASSLPRISSSPIVLLPLFAMVVGMPMSQVPPLPDLKQTRLNALLESLVSGEESMHRLCRPLFGALMTALMENLNRNLLLGLTEEDGEVRVRAIYCVEETLGALKEALQGSTSFMEASKSKEFIIPVVQSIFACADVVDLLQQQNAGGRKTAKASVTATAEAAATTAAAEPVLGDTFKEELLPLADGFNGGGSSLPPTPGTTSSNSSNSSSRRFTTTDSSFSTSRSSVDARHNFEGAEAQRLLLLLKLVLRDSFLTPTGQAASDSTSAHALVREAFLAFPHTAMDAHIFAFYQTFLVLLTDLIKEALRSGDGILVGNTVAVCSVLFEVAQKGLLPPPLLATALELCLKAAREISGTRINKSLGSDLQQLLLANAISIGQAFSVVALRRAARYVDATRESEAILAAIHAHLHLLLSHTKRPVRGTASLGLSGVSTGGAGGLPPSTRAGVGGGVLSSTHGGKWRKTFAPNLPLDETGIDVPINVGSAGAGGASVTLSIPSTPSDLSQPVNSMSSVLSRVHDLCAQFGPDKDEPFVACLLSELRVFLLCGSEGGRYGRRRLAARVCEVLLKQRQNVMAELLSFEVREKQGKSGGKEKKILDIYSRGFLLLSSGVGEEGMGRGEVEADARLERFEEWFSSAEAGEEVTQVFGMLRDKADMLLPDDMIPTVDVLNRLQAAKVPAFSLGQSSAHARLTRGEQLNVRKAFETFINFHQHIIRSGLADIANGSMHWKEVLCSLRGVVSVWEGVDVHKGKEENRWATASPDAKEAATRSLHQNFMWRLDLTEGPERMRRRMKRNYEFEEVYNVMERPVLEPFVTGQLPSGVVAALEEEEKGGEEGKEVKEEEWEDDEEEGKLEGGNGEGAGERSVCTPPGRCSSTGGGEGGEEGEAGSASLVGSLSASSLEGMLMQDVDFDLRATTKLIKQVALVHMHSGVGRGGEKVKGYRRHDEEYDEEDLIDLYESEDGKKGLVELPGVLNRAADDSQLISDVDTTVGEKKEEEKTGKKLAKRVERRKREEDRSLSLAGSSPDESRGEGERDEVSSETKTSFSGREMTADSLDLGATACPFNDTVVAMKAGGRIGTALGDSVNIVGDSRSGGGSSTSAPLDLIHDESQDTSSSTLPPALRTQVSMADIDSSHQSNTSGSLALLAMEAAAACSESNDGDLVANELIAGFVDESDGPILRLYNVQRCTGLEVNPALLLFCRHGLVIVDGFAKVAGGEGSSSGSCISIKRVALSSTAYSNSNATFSGATSSTSITDSSGTYRSSSSIPQQVVSGIIGGKDTGVSNSAAQSFTSSTTPTTSSFSTEDLDHRFNVYLRASDIQKDGCRPSAAATCMKTLNNPPLPSTSSIRKVPYYQGTEEDEGFAKATASLGRIGFDLENPPHVERMRFDRLKILYKRRYQFRHVAIEFFDVDGKSFLVALQTPDEQTQVVDLVMDAPLVKSVFWSNNQDGALQKLGGGGRINYKRFMAHWRQQLTSKWQNGRMTNFEYLMHLNALAGRSVHDLTQYPVFPWVLSDYTSVDLDLTNPSVYRDLRKPMGALGETRAKQFRERFDQLASLVEDLSPEEAAGEAPPFHYGTHYSCAGYVLYYLLRLEPYARLHLQLQGGKFDKADRLFRDIKSSWDSASRENLQDVRELIPEFFYLPEFLTNHNQFDYGWLQKGLAVNHVMLPPWAKGDAREFVRLQRMALESKYVSENLSYWIDLIFGCKQTGPEAVEAQNLFVHLTYEGVVDIDAIQDPVIREATIAQIHNFGQTPSRLFKRPHPVRRVPVPLQSFQQDEGSVTLTGGTAAVAGLGGSSIAGYVSNSSSSSGSIVPRYIDPSSLAWHQYTTPSLCIVGAPQTIALRPTSTAQLGAPYGGAIPSAVQPVGDVWTVKDRAVGVGLDCALVPPNLVKYARYGSPDYGLAFRVAVPTTRHQYIDRVVSVHEQLHLGAVNCLALDEAGELAVTGSKDSTIRVWCMSKQQAYAQPPQLHSASGGGGKTLSLQATLCGHSNEILCVDVAAQLGILLSGGADRLAVAWDVRDFTSQRVLVGHASPVTSVSINKRTGDMVTLGGVDIRVWSVTGEPLAQVSAIAVVKEVPTCVVATDCPEWQNGVVAVTGHDNGKLCLWGLQNLSDDMPGRSVIDGEVTAAVVAMAGEGSPGGGGEGGRRDRVCKSSGDESNSGEEEVDVGSNTGTTQGRQLRVMQILQGVHTASITAIRVGRDQRDLAVGDAMGRCSRWASVRLDQLPEKEIMELALTARKM